MTKKTALRLTFEAVPFHVFLENTWFFFRKPEIRGERLNDSLLRFAGHNFVASLFLVITVVTFIQYLLPQLFDVDLGHLINPIYLTLMLAFQAIAFAYVLTFIISVFLLPRQPAFHHLIAHQTLQVYSVLNLLVVVMFWVGINRVLKTGNIQSASSSLDLWLGGGIGILALYLSWRLLIKPLWNYTANYYPKHISFVLSATAIIVSLWCSSYAEFGLGDLVINKQAMCEQIYKTKRQQGEIGNSVNKNCFIGHCMSQKDAEP